MIKLFDKALEAYGMLKEIDGMETDELQFANISLNNGIHIYKGLFELANLLGKKVEVLIRDGNDYVEYGFIDKGIRVFQLEEIDKK